MDNMIYTVKMLEKNLTDAGIKAGDTLLVHSSMKSIGQVEDRADGVFRALMNVITEAGLLLFPTFSDRSVTGSNPDYHPATSPAWTGILPELFRKRSDTVRSLHPFHSLTAWGRDAVSFTAGHDQFDTAFDIRSPWGRLLERDAKVLLIGVDLTSATFLHPVEQWCNVPVLSKEPFLRYIVDDQGNRTPRTIHWHTGAHSENYFRAESLLLEQNGMKKCQFGAAPSFLMNCRKTLQIMEPVLKQNPDFFAH
jgi:aminoglycoside 3-N-acetyltransferase